MKKIYTISLLALACSAVVQAATPTSELLTGELIRVETKQSDYLRSVSPSLEQKMIQVADNVYVATGYDASNVTMILGDTGYVIVDSGKFPANTKKISDDFKAITDKPLEAVIFTHGHNDHVGGLSSFVKDYKTIKTFGADNLGDENAFDEEAGHKNFRSYRQNGSKLPMDERINNGVALPLVFPAAKPSADGAAGELVKKQPYAPAITHDNLSNPISAPVTQIEVAGLKLELIRAYGETNDHLLVFYPEKGVLFTGDLIYRSFPNLYTIRGTKYRDVNRWVESLNLMLEKEATTLVMGHTRPFQGKAEVKSALTNYRDAVSYVFNKSIEGMNKGLTPDELVEYAKLPVKLAKDPNLAPLYGSPDWAVRSIFEGYLGWFDGNPTSLKPMPPKQEAQKYIDAMGGIQKVQALAQKAITDKEYKWALQLADKLLAADNANQTYKNIKADALVLLADNTLNTLARNYYKSYALELRQGKI